MLRRAFACEGFEECSCLDCIGVDRLLRVSACFPACDDFGDSLVGDFVWLEIAPVGDQVFGELLSMVGCGICCPDPYPLG